MCKGQTIREFVDNAAQTLVYTENNTSPDIFHIAPATTLSIIYRPDSIAGFAPSIE